MKLVYNGGNRKISWVVRKANHILFSNFYYSELDKILDLDKHHKDSFLYQFRSFDKPVEVKNNWNPLQKKNYSIKNHSMVFNSANLNKSHRIVLSQVLEAYACILKEESEISKTLADNEVEHIPALMGKVGRSFI